MWWVQYAMLFVAAMVASIGAFSGRARGFASLIGMFAWFIWGNASAAVIHYDGAGTEHVATSIPLTWLAYAVAAIHLIVLLLTIHDILTKDEDDDETAEDIAEGIDPAAITPSDITDSL